MTSLISTFFIEPVIRHARRFSSQGSANSRPSPSPSPQDTAAAGGAGAGAAPGGRPHPDARAPVRSHANAHDNATTTTSVTCASTGADAHSDSITERHEAIADIEKPALSDNSTLHHFVPLLPDANAGARPRKLQTSNNILTPQPPGESCDDTALPEHIIDSKVESPCEPLEHGNMPTTRDNLLRVPQPTTAPPTTHRRSSSIAVVDDTDMTPSLPAQVRGGRTTSARDIPRPQMSLREDSPSKAVRSLPADDGMRMLRQRIHEIRELQASQTEKARQMHDLMTEDWQAAQFALRPLSPASMTSQDRTFMPSSPLSTITMPTSPESIASIPAPPFDPSNPFHIHPEDLQLSYRPLSDSDHTTADEPTHDPSSSDPLEPVLGCKHYKRNVKIQCYDCKEWHSCRHCHDASVTTHHLNRKKTENMLCMLCWTPQAASQYCKECGESAAWYYCDICKLWDDDASKRIYHCADCGICRRGEGLGKDFVHCKKCNVCISIAHYATHTCIENATDSNCPLCLDYMFTSPLEIVAMPCGHYLHHHCYTSLMLSSYQCPICKRSAVNMETQWRKLEEEIRLQPMPREWIDVKIEVKCNDCAGVSVAPYHWLGVKCGRCDGFNTVQIRLLAAEDVRRDVQDFAEQRRERRAEISAREPFRRTFTAPVTVRPYFLDDDHDQALQDGVPPRSARALADGFQNPFSMPELPRLPEFASVSSRLPNLAEYSGRLPSGLLPNMPNMPSMPGFNFSFDVLDRVGRGLSPIRHYFDDQIADGVPRQFMLPSPHAGTGANAGAGGGVRTRLEGEEQEQQGWRGDGGWFVESSEDEEEEEENDDDEDEEEGSEEEDSDGDEESSDDDGVPGFPCGGPYEDDDDDEDDEAGRGKRLHIELTGHR